jgi:hypothetical protein
LTVPFALAVFQERLIMASVGPDYNVRVWDLLTGSTDPLLEIPWRNLGETPQGNIVSVSYEDAGQLVALIPHNNDLLLISAARTHHKTLDLVSRRQLFENQGGWYLRVRNALTGELLVMKDMYHDSFVKRLSDRLPGVKDAAGNIEIRHEPYICSIDCFISDHGNLLIASGSDDRTVCLWNAFAGKLEHRPFKHDKAILQLSFLKPRSGLVLVSFAEDNMMRVWHVGTGREIARLPLEAKPWAIDIHQAKNQEELVIVTEGQDPRVFVILHFALRELFVS